MPTYRLSTQTALRLRGHTMRLVWLSVQFLAAPLAGGLYAQDCALPATIAADRPGNLTLPLVLPAGHAQLETGWSRSHSGDVRSQVIAATLLRFGLSCGTELRLASAGWLSVDGAGAASRGLGDAWVGTKIRLLGGSGPRPHLALLSGLLLPTHTISSHQRTEPEVNLTAMWDLPNAQTAALFTGISSRWTGSAFVGERLSGASWAFPVGTLASFVEYSEFVRPRAASRYLATGLQFFPRASIQFDVFVTLPLPRPGSDAAFGFGLARRW